MCYIDKKKKEQNNTVADCRRKETIGSGEENLKRGIFPFFLGQLHTFNYSNADRYKKKIWANKKTANFLKGNFRKHDKSKKI